MYERPQLVINIVDASNLERNLYLTVQLLELGVPVVLALNMVDAAAGRGIEVDAEELSRRMQVPVIPTIARTGKGKEGLLETTANVAAENHPWKPVHISYGTDIDPVLDQMEADIQSSNFLLDLYPARWIALKYMEADEQVLESGKKVNPELSNRLEEAADQVAEHLRKTLETYPEAIIADHRYGFISALLKGGVVHNSQKSDRLYLSDQLDQVLTNRFFGPLVMLLILYGVYKFTFEYSALPVSWLDSGFTALGNFMESVLPAGLIKSLIVSGIIDGVGGVLSFIPLILFMFFSIAFLEDTGYLARVAYMLDRVFRTFGLHGSSVMAYIVSGGIAGGCAVPGVMATRTLRSPKERLATILTAPFMNCGAKLPVFAMLIAAFFPARHAQMMFLLTILSWIAALLLARLIRWTILRGPSTPFLLELPPYRMPTLKGLLIHTWERTWQYIRKAGTIILALSILFWALMTFPMLPESRKNQFETERQQILSQLPKDARISVTRGQKKQSDVPQASARAIHRIKEINEAEARATLQHSYAGRIGMALESLTQWSGFEWRTNVALLAGFAAKELIISTLGTAYSLGGASPEEEVSLSQRLVNDPQWNRLRAFSLIVFIMLYAPCLATVTCIAKESGTVKWALFSLVFNTTVAYLVAVLIYQGGLWLGVGG